jgi:hypothetical protein
MFKTKLAILIAAGALITSAASAMPLSNLSASVQADQPVEQVRLVCNDRGHCWRTDSRSYERSYDRRSYKRPSYGYGAYGSPHRYHQQPSVGLNFRF